METNIKKQLEDELSELANYDDGAEEDESPESIVYDITSYGADYDVAGLINRINNDSIFIPPFQRNYVWNIYEASRFIESLLLGLPVPGVFLARENETNRLLVIDGQQRLKSLQFFYSGVFNPKEGDTRQRLFKLHGVDKRFNGKTYKKLDEKDRLFLDDTIIHATVIKQESPRDGNSSIYHVFERLNTGGRVLSPQEIRTAVYHGGLISLLFSINSDENWRAIFGKPNSRLKDQELILRFLALYYNWNSYTKPMKAFLNNFVETNKNPSPEVASEYSNLFRTTISFARLCLGERAFRTDRTLNAAIFDSVMVGLANMVSSGNILPKTEVQSRYTRLTSDETYQKHVSQSTSDDKSVYLRISEAIKAFSG